MRSRNLIAVACAVGAALTVSAGTALADTNVADPHTVISFKLPPTDKTTNVSVCDYSNLSSLEAHFAADGDPLVNAQTKSRIETAVDTDGKAGEQAFNFRHAFCSSSSSSSSPSTSAVPAPVDNGPDNGTVSCADARTAQQDAFVRLNDAINHLNAVDAQVVKDSGGDPTKVSFSDQQLVRDASRQENNRQVAWQRARNHRIEVCRDNGGDDGAQLVLVQPAPAGTTYVSAPSSSVPAVSSGSGVVSVTPQKAPDTGDGSLAGELR